MNVSMYMCMVACYSDTDPFVRPSPIWIRARCEPDTLVIRKPTHEITRRSVSVLVVKTRGWFGPETASFHVSIYFCIIAIYCYQWIFYLPSLDYIYV